MALILGVSERTIQRWKPETLKQKRLSQEEVKKIYELKEEGKSSRGAFLPNKTYAGTCLYMSVAS